MNNWNNDTNNNNLLANDEFPLCFTIFYALQSGCNSATTATKNEFTWKNDLVSSFFRVEVNLIEIAKHKFIILEFVFKLAYNGFFRCKIERDTLGDLLNQTEWQRERMKEKNDVTFTWGIERIFRRILFHNQWMHKRNFQRVGQTHTHTHIHTRLRLQCSQQQKKIKKSA